MDKLFQTKHVDNGPARIQYRVSKGQGQTVCLLPSVARGSEDLEALAYALIEHGYKVILPEPRGINGSTGPMEKLDLHDLAKDVLATIEPETTNCVVAGHAFGSIVARTCASDRPDLVSAVILLAAGASQFPEYLSEAINTLTHSNANKDQKTKALRIAFFAHEQNIKETWLDGWHQHLLHCQREARKSTASESWYGAGTVPILDIIGEKDPFRSPDQHNEILKKYGDRVEIALIKDASHALPDEHPKAVSDAIAQFLISRSSDWFNTQKI